MNFSFFAQLYYPKDKSEINIVSWVWLGLFILMQNIWDFPYGLFGHLIGKVRLRTVQNERFVFSLLIRGVIFLNSFTVFFFLSSLSFTKRTWVSSTNILLQILELKLFYLNYLTLTIAFSSRIFENYLSLNNWKKQKDVRLKNIE